MKQLNLTALLLGAVLFTGLGAVSLSADDKCGAGKCGSSKVEKPAKKSADAKKESTEKCGDAKKVPAKKCGSK